MINKVLPPLNYTPLLSSVVGFVIQIYITKKIVMRKNKAELLIDRESNSPSFPAGATRLYYLKSAQIWSFFWSVFSCIRTEYGYLIRIQSEYMEIRTRKNSVFGHFSRIYIFKTKSKHRQSSPTVLIFGVYQS